MVLRLPSTITSLKDFHRSDIPLSSDDLINFMRRLKPPLWFWGVLRDEKTNQEWRVITYYWQGQRSEDFYSPTGLYCNKNISMLNAPLPKSTNDRRLNSLQKNCAPHSESEKKLGMDLVLDYSMWALLFDHFFLDFGAILLLNVSLFMLS